jgi:SLT domain-containing protein
MSQMQTESGGNARAINLWDSNARAGIPSKGLMQVIDPTFNAYAGPYLSRGIWDPKANIYAGVNYALRRYGANVARVLGRGVGYATGGIIGEPVVGIGMRSGTPYRFGERGPELVSPLAGPGPNVAYGGGSRIAIAVYPSPGMDERALAAAVARELAWAQAGGQI